MQARLFHDFSEKNLKPWVYGFILLHVIVWTLAPALVRLCLPMDALEGTTWGQQLEWGYDKNPFMNAWASALAVKISQPADWAIYLFSQISVALCFWSVWSVGKRITSPIYAFIAILLLACTQYYNLHAIDFNDNTLELGLWGLSIAWFYRALRSHKLSDWLMLGVFIGLSMMTKYFVVVLLVPMLLFMFVRNESRDAFKKPGFYLAIFICCLICLPHIVWLCQHDFITISYAFKRVNAPSHVSNHLFYPLQFLWQQFEVFLPALLLLGLLWLGVMPAKADIQASSFDKSFLLWMGLGPLLTTVLLSAVMGMKLRAGWGQPLLSFLGLFLVVWFTPVLTERKLKTFFTLCGIIIVAMVVGYYTAIMRADAPSTANFPGKIIAGTLEKEWHDQYHTPLKYVVGSRWISGNISFYSQDKPSVFIDANNQLSPWIRENDLKQHGALFVWDPTEHKAMDVNEIKKRYPNLGPLNVMHFTWLRKIGMKPIEISVALLPPESAFYIKNNI